MPARVRERVATIDVETGHLVQMVNELLDLSRIEQAATQLHLDDVAVGPLLTASAARSGRSRTGRASRSRLNLPEAPLPPVWGDADRLGQLLLNLLHNAVKFSRCGAVRDARPTASRVARSWSAWRTRGGHPGPDQPRIFERFFKVDRARERGQGGTGLGLAIARHIAEAHRGRIWFESEDGQGSTFFVALPRRRRTAGASRRRPARRGSTARDYLLIAVGGAAGAVSRYVVDDLSRALIGGAFPMGTLVVNLTGSFVLGLLFAARHRSVRRCRRPPGAGHDRLHRRLHHLLHLDARERAAGRRGRMAPRRRPTWAVPSSWA